MLMLASVVMNMGSHAEWPRDRADVWLQLCLTSKLPLHVNQLVHHQSLPDSQSAQRRVVLRPLWKIKK